MGRIYLIRHGEVEANRVSTYVGSTDLPLNKNGLAQAELLAQRLASENLAAVYCSDLTRARQTAEAVARVQGIGIRIVPQFREFDYGDWEGVPEAEVPVRYGDLFHQWRATPVDVRVPGGETFAELRDRAFPTLERIAEEHRDESVAVVAHKSTNRTLLCCVMGIDVNKYRQIGQNNAAINVIEVRADGRLVVDRINECGHLNGERR